MSHSSLAARPWLKDRKPRRILAIRFQALGDTLITLPYLQSFKTQHPGIHLDFLTRKEVAAVPRAIKLFDRVFALGGKRNVKLQTIYLLLLLPLLWWRRYEVVIDLQNNRLSRLAKRLLWVKPGAFFDNHSLISAGERTRLTIESINLGPVHLSRGLTLSQPVELQTLLLENGWKPDHQLVILNPAGFFPSRQWPINRYVEFARAFSARSSAPVQFVLLLLPPRKTDAAFISRELGELCIDLTGKADQVTAFSIIGISHLMLSEDSGLMHMAWIQGVPTLALFSSSRKVWSAPQGEWSLCLDSSDLDCGPCMQAVCKFGDNRCLTRYSAEFVAGQALSLLNRNLR